MRGVWRLFAQSPFEPVEQHMAAVMDCVALLRPLFEAVAAEDGEAIAEVVSRIDGLEAVADQVKNEIRNHLPKALFLPVDRRDLLDVLHMQDSMADSLQEAAGLLTLRPMHLPASLREPMLKFVDDVLAACQRAHAILDRLDELVEATFGGIEAERVLALIDELDAAETKSELMCRQVMTKLFALDQELGAVELMLWREILLRTADIANYAERAGNRLRLLLAKP